MQITCMPYKMVKFAEKKSLQQWLDFATGFLDGIEIIGVDSDSSWSLIGFLKQKVEKETLTISMLDIRHSLIPNLYEISNETNRQSIDNIKNDINLAKCLNISLLRCAAVPGWYDYSGTDFEVAYDFIMENLFYILKTVLPFAEDHDVKILIENHPGDISVKKEFFDTLFNEFSSPCLGINFDLVNTLFYPHQKPEDFLEDPQILTRAHCFHIDNIAPAEKGCEKLAIDNGKLNSIELLKKIRDSGYDGWLSFEYSGSSKEDISKSVELIKKIWRGNER